MWLEEMSTKARTLLAPLPSSNDPPVSSPNNNMGRNKERDENLLSQGLRTGHQGTLPMTLMETSRTTLNSQSKNSPQQIDTRKRKHKDNSPKTRNASTNSTRPSPQTQERTTSIGTPREPPLPDSLPSFLTKGNELSSHHAPRSAS